MKVLIAPNSMKGSLNAFDFADIVEKALLDVSLDFDIQKIPVADGGDLTGEILAKNMSAQTIELDVHDPLGKIIRSKYAKAGSVAIIEMADASGMKLLQAEELNPMHTSSFGTGELIRHALDNECTKVFLAIGGSATVDGGLGMMRALGFRLLDDLDRVLEGSGKDLIQVKKILPSELLEKVKIRIICDVDNPLLGKQGAANVFGPQKGATSQMVYELEEGLKNLAKVLFNQSGKDLKDIPGIGAAGGMALPLLAFTNAEIVPGADFICEELKVEQAVKWADLVITGEGKIDGQTLNNKAPFAVSKLARKHGVPVIAIGGQVDEEASETFDGCFSIVTGPLSINDAMEHAGDYLYRSTFELGKFIHAFNSFKAEKK